jgi:predicted amidohydrolase
VPEQYYEFTSYFKSENVDQVDRSVLSQITWLADDSRRVAFIEYPGVRSKPANGDWNVLQQTYQVPSGATKAKIDLIYRWNQQGIVYFGGTSLKETDAIKPRMVRLAAIHYRPTQTASSKENLEQFKKYIDEAGDQNADIVCLPEGITIVGTDKSYVEVSEPIPGPTTDFLGQLAQKYQMYIVAGILEREGAVVYNTAVLMDRDGKLAGKYRKATLPREEIAGGITPGDDFPVFETDFGKIGMMICWDVFFPEPARTLSSKGAEIIFMPIWGGDLTLSKARAIENQIYLVSSTYDMKTGVFDKKGELIVEGTEENPVAIVEVDLNKRELWEWLGEFRNRIQREMPSDEAINN